MTNDPRQLALSPSAARLLDVLRRLCHRRDAAQSDAWLADRIGVSPREVIDLADELLRAGWAVIAETREPYGRWLVTESAQLADAHRYRQSLRHRGVQILLRARAVRCAIEATSIRLRTAPDQATGQGYLFGDAETPAAAGRSACGEIRPGRRGDRGELRRGDAVKSPAVPAGGGR